MKAKRLKTRIKTTSIIVVKALATTLSAFILSSFSKDKTIYKDIFEESIRGIIELKVEMSTLKNKIKR